jgi:hypothetical protein
VLKNSLFFTLFQWRKGTACRARQAIARKNRQAELRVYKLYCLAGKKILTVEKNLREYYKGWICCRGEACIARIKNDNIQVARERIG